MAFMKRIKYGIDYVKQIISTFVSDHNIDKHAHINGFDHGITINTASEEPYISFRTTYVPQNGNHQNGQIVFHDNTNFAAGSIDCDGTSDENCIEIHVNAPGGSGNPVVCSFRNSASRGLYIASNATLNAVHCTTPKIDDTSANYQIANKLYADTIAANKASTVQSNLNTHVNDVIKHITATERATWNSKADSDHTHSDLLKLIASSLGVNGYIQLGNNLIVQWGATTTFTTFSFPKKFTTIYGVLGTKSIVANSSNNYYPVGNNRPGNRTEENGICVTYTTEKARFYSRDCNDNGENTGIRVFWIAIGKI